MRSRRFLGLAVILALLAAGERSPAAEADADLEYAMQRLKEGGLTTEGPALVQFFRQRTLDEAGRRRLAETVRRLGAPAYPARQKAYRELLAAGRGALPFVRPALQDPDPEIASRARRLISQLESDTEVTLLMAAARVLAARKPDGAVGALLDYLPQAGDERVEEAVLDALDGVGRDKDKIHPALVRALRDPEPLRRLAAAHVFGKVRPGERGPLRPLLADPDPRVRFQAAAALVRAGDRSAVPPLLELLEAPGAETVAWQAEDLLLRIAGKDPPQTSLGSTAAERQACRKAWTDWWRVHSGRIDLAKINFNGAFHNLTVVCDCDTSKDRGGRVWEFGPDGKERWHFTGSRAPVDVQLLPNGRLLVAEGATSLATERSRDGKVLHTYQVGGYATTARRLPNGNTLLAGYSEIKEVTPQGTAVFTWRSRWGSIYRVQRLPDGHLVFVTGTRLLELDARGKEVRSIAIPVSAGIWAHAEKLPSGRYLVALYSAGKVIEIDSAGKVHLEIQVRTPSSASLLPSGHILVSSMDARRIIEFNRQGKEVWSKATQGRPFLVRRY